jgi:hypothetical protein
VTLTLRATQEWFARAVTTPESEAEPAGGAQASQRLTRGPRLEAIDRLEIYRRAYHSRLVECLVDDYPTLQAALGEDAFATLCREYIARYPSTNPNLNTFGRHMAALCASEAGGAHAAFAADLAALEWALVEVIHAPSTEPLSLAALGDVPPERWAGARLESTPALRILCAAYPVNAFYQAVRDGKQPAIPDAAPSATAVYRSGPTVWRMDLTPPMLALLTGLTSGATLADALDGATASFGDEPEEAAAQRVMGWFREWVSSGLFSRVAW